nr:MAG TPA: hypothetical protein [Caudoviricetes sp.]
MIEIKAVPGKLIMLGKQGENLAREVVFDVSGVRAEFGDGTFRLSARRAGESNVYPAAVTENGDTVEWSLTAADTQNAGRGQCELAYYAGETRLKTWTYDTAIAKSLTGSPKTDPYDEFLDEVNRLAAEAAISQREAKNSENAAKNSEENAKASEDAAKTSENNAAEYARAALAAEKKSEQNAENAASAAVSAGQYAQNAAVSATNAANSASAAETHEKGAKDAAAAAAKSAEGLADAVKRAEDAATIAQDNAGKTAADREAVAEMRTAAQTAQSNAEKAATAAAGSATSAGESAVAAETSRKGAAEIKAQIDEVKAGIDQVKADIDQTKIDTLAAKTAAETAAATATEKAAEIADSAAQIAENTENIETNATDIDLLRRENTELKAKTDALWKLSEGKSYDFVEDATEAYSKDVPSGCRFAQVEKIGGKTVARSTGELVSAGVEDVKVQGANLLDPSKTTAGVGKPYGLTITMVGDNTFHLSGVPSAEVTSKNEYAFSVAENSQTELRGRGLKITAWATKGIIINAWGLRTENEKSLAVSATLTPGVNTDIEFRFMVSTATPSAYSPYSLDTYPIPDAVKALPGYGWSAGSVCNEIVRRADGWDYVQRVGLPATTDGYTALDTPTTTDITDLMTGALPLMTTEPGGTITMHHALADDGLTLDVPNDIKYIRDLKEVASSDTE